MKLHICLVIVLALTIAVPTHAFLGAKLQLLSSLKGGITGGSGFGGGNGFGLGNLIGGGNSYGGSYGGGYSYSPPSRPYYSGNSGSYGYGYDRSASYNGNYASNYQDGNVNTERIVRIIKVVVPSQENVYTSSNYAGGYTSGWTPVPQPAPVQVPVQVAAPQPYPVQVAVPYPQPAAVQPVLPVERSQPIPVSVPVQVAAPQPIAVSPTVVRQEQPVVKTVRLVVSENDVNQGGLSQTYGPPAYTNNYAAGWGQNGASWGNNGWNNLGSSKGWKSGGIWEKLGC